METAPLTAKELRTARAQFKALKDADKTWAVQSKALFKHAFKIEPSLRTEYSNPESKILE